MIGALEKPWWDDHISSDLTAGEIVEEVERLFPEHPAHKLISKAAQGYQKAVEKDFSGRTFLCPRCMDVGWVFVDTRGRGVVRRCNGPMATQCRFVEQQKIRAAEKSRPVGEDGETRFS